MRRWTRTQLTHALFPALRFRSPVSVKTVSVMPFRKRCCRSRHIGEWPGIGPLGWRASFPRMRVGRAPVLLLRQRKNRTRFYMNGSTATANLLKRRTLFFYVSYGILTDERNSYFWNGDAATNERKRYAGAWKPRISYPERYRSSACSELYRLATKGTCENWTRDLMIASPAL